MSAMQQGRGHPTAEPASSALHGASHGNWRYNPRQGFRTMRDRFAASLIKATRAIRADRAAHATLTIMTLAIAAAILGGRAITAQTSAARRPWTAPKTE